MLPQFAKLFLRETVHISHDMSVHLLSNVKVETELFIVNTLNAFTITQGPVFFNFISQDGKFPSIFISEVRVRFVCAGSIPRGKRFPTNQLSINQMHH